MIIDEKKRTQKRRDAKDKQRKTKAKQQRLTESTKRISAWQKNDRQKNRAKHHAG